jgi:ligand-binding SRPBCC domain-containing protein
MPHIYLETKIYAPQERCFDLARSIDLHCYTTSSTNEKAVAGITSGLINEGEFVTWRAKHFGVWQELTSVISKMERPYHFEDRMRKGIFKSIIHKHSFEKEGNVTIMKDDFFFEAPCGIAGKIFSKFILTDYLRKFLIERNRIIKGVAESDEWKRFI